MTISRHRKAYGTASKRSRAESGYICRLRALHKRYTGRPSRNISRRQQTSCLERAVSDSTARTQGASHRWRIHALNQRDTITTITLCPGPKMTALRITRLRTNVGSPQAVGQRASEKQVGLKVMKQCMYSSILINLCGGMSSRDRPSSGILHHNTLLRSQRGQKKLR